MPRRSPRPRTVRRRLGREESRRADEREKLALAEPGGAPERPLEVDSPTQVDVIAERTRCARCGESMRLVRHEAAVVDGTRLRVAHLACVACGRERCVYFRLAAGLLE
jgi:uncharacterized protein with PIN domain